jgi:hypothetical protein
MIMTSRVSRAHRALVPTILALAGASGPATAQPGNGFLLDAPTTLSPAEPTVTIHLLAAFPIDDYAFAGARFDVLATEPGWRDPALVAPGGTGPST